MNILTILAYIPLWVYLLFSYLLCSGIRNLSTHTTSPWRLLIVPSTFTLWTLYSIQMQYGFSLDIIQVLAGGFIAGFILSPLFMPYPLFFQEDKIVIPGSYTPLLISLCFFAIKYSFGVLYALNPLHSTEEIFWISHTLLSGLITGISVGRAGRILKIYLGF